MESLISFGLNLFTPGNILDWIVWAIACLPSLIGLGLLMMSWRRKQKSKQIMQIIDRYNSVHLAVDDYMETVAIYLPAVVGQMSAAIERVKGLNLSDQSYLEHLGDQIGSVRALAQHLHQDNQNSRERAESNTPNLTATSPNPFKSPFVWSVVTLILLSESLLLYAFQTTLPPPVVIGVVCLSLLLFILAYCQHGKHHAKQKKTEKYASLVISLFGSRREFIADTSSQITKSHLSLMQASQQLTSVPQARGFFSGLVNMAKLGNSTTTVHRASDMDHDAPLFAAGIALGKLIQKRYQPAANERHLQLDSRLEDGLAFQIFPKDFMELADQIASNAITYSKPGDKINIIGKRRGSKIVIAISDNGAGIGREGLLYLFSPKHVVEPSPDKEFKVSLGLQICKVIVCRFGGELKVSSKLGKGSVATIIAPRKITQMKLDIPRHVSTSVGVLDQS